MARADRGKGGPVEHGRAIYLLRALGWSPRDAVGVVLGVFVTLAILINVLFLQSGSHPAPMFKGARGPVRARRSCVRGRSSRRSRRRRARSPRRPRPVRPARSSTTSSANWRAAATTMAPSTAFMARRLTLPSEISSRLPGSSRAPSRTTRCCRPSCDRPPRL